MVLPTRKEDHWTRTENRITVRFQFSKAVQPFRGEDWFSLWMKYAVNCRPVMGILLSVSTAHQAEVRANGREELITATLRYKLNSLKHLNSALATAGCEVSEDLLHAVGSHAAIEVSLMFQICRPPLKLTIYQRQSL